MERLTIIILFIFMGCSTEQETAPEKGKKKEDATAKGVIEEAITFHGMEDLDQDTLKFKFRKKKYVFKSNEKEFQYERIFTDPKGDSIRDVLTNEGFERYKNDSLIALSPKDSMAYSNSVNSVIYFAFLPFQLNNKAVIAFYKGKDTIKEKVYHRIKVNFKEEGGGEDHEDTFMYWFHTEDASMDFLAYRYHTEGGGVRFREAYNPRRIDGILIQDYHNYKAPYRAKLERLDEQWEKGELEKLSEIDLKFTGESSEY